MSRPRDGGAWTDWQRLVRGTIITIHEHLRESGWQSCPWAVLSSSLVLMGASSGFAKLAVTSITQGGSREHSQHTNDLDLEKECLTAIFRSGADVLRRSVSLSE
jgi:hypothetical protein